ncbi:MAG: polysaccharide biosynthesis tyrosine autokinase [Rikenellaceae bacterium]
MRQNDFNDITREEASEGISLRDLLQLFISKWYIFIICITLALLCSYIYLRITPPIYTRSAEILIKEDNNGGSIYGGAANDLANLGIINTSSNVGNEMRTLQSLTLSAEVVNILDLNISYYAITPWRKELLYGANNPIKVIYGDHPIHLESSFEITPRGGDHLELGNFKWEDGESEQSITTKFGEQVNTPIGALVVEKSPLYATSPMEQRMSVTHSDIYNTSRKYTKKLSVALSSKESSTILISLSDQSPQRADDYINTLISVYNENWIKDRNQISASTDKFITERLAAISSSLGDVDDDISSFKSENMMPDIDLATSMYMEESNKLDGEIMELNNQISMARYIRDYLTSDANRNLLLPANSGVESANIESQITSYNELQLQRNRVVANSSTTNPIVVNFDKELSAMRAAIITSIDNQMVTLQTRMKSITQRDRKASQRIVDNPKQAKELLSVSRQQKVMEAIYLYLLQKREENQLTQAFTAYNTRIINLPSGSLSPTSPKRIHVLVIAIALGLLLPALFIYLKESMITVVRGRNDLDGLKITLLGEIPQVVNRKRSWLKRIFTRDNNEDSSHLVVKARSRNPINEAFRIIRTNMEFMLKPKSGSKVIMVTSLTPGSGKSFVTLNLAVSFAIKGSRVLIIDLDIRKATISTTLTNAERGISDYLNHSVESLSSLIERGGYFPNLGVDNSDESKAKGNFFPTLDLLPVGTIPPNPTELLVDDRLEMAFEELRREYDYIFVDSPPSEIVADVSIINNYVDMTLYIARVGHIERSMLKVIDSFYTDQKYKNISMILNGSGAIGRYGYGNYGYGYGYGNSED